VVTEHELVEELRILWPSYFSDRSAAPPCPIEHRGVAAARETTRSMREHFAAGTLELGIGKIAMPALFAHGLDDPLPVRASVQTAKRIPGARVARIPNYGHFPGSSSRATSRDRSAA
jgi:pimeloyl-ACP methyl ester carboxylesterase